jgi:signal transduction histidine kinase
VVLAAQITLTFEQLEATRLEVFGDSDQLCRLVSNLIVNAVQYTPAGGIVTIILERSDRHAIIRVRDTGIGGERKKVWEVWGVWGVWGVIFLILS